MSETQDERADRLAAVAVQLPAMVRDYDPHDVRAWLVRRLPVAVDRDDLIHLLAAAIPVDRPWLELTAWARDGLPAAPDPSTDDRPGPILVRRDRVDEVRIQRAVDGYTVRLNRLEKREALRRLVEGEGLSLRQAAVRLGRTLTSVQQMADRMGLRAYSQPANGGRRSA